MINEKIMSVHNALGHCAGEVPEDIWAMIRAARDVLADCAERVRLMEGAWPVADMHRAGRCGDGCACQGHDNTFNYLAEEAEEVNYVHG